MPLDESRPRREEEPEPFPISIGEILRVVRDTWKRGELSIEVCKRHTEMFVGYGNFYLHGDPVHYHTPRTAVVWYLHENEPEYRVPAPFQENNRGFMESLEAEYRRILDAYNMLKERERAFLERLGEDEEGSDDCPT
jgi:hypothetical protein